MEYKKKIAELIKMEVDIDIEVLVKLIEIPPKEELGDYAFPCFHLVQVYKKAPMVIAEELKNKIVSKDFEKIESLGSYLNFFRDKAIFAENTINRILQLGDKYGETNIGVGKKICIEFSSQKIGRTLTVENLATTVIGNSFYKLFKIQGYDVQRINMVEEWGMPVGKLIYAYKCWGDEKALQMEPIVELERLSVKYYEEVEKKPSLEADVKMCFKELLYGDRETNKLWNKIVVQGYRGYKEVYNSLNIQFHMNHIEGFYQDKIDILLDELRNKGLVQKSNGTNIVNLHKYNMPPCIITDEDGMAKVSMKDITTIVNIKETYKFHKYIYVKSITERLYINQIFNVLELAGYEWVKDCSYVGVGLVKVVDENVLGGTAVYVQSTYAKGYNIISNGPKLESKPDFSRINSKIELQLINILDKYMENINIATETLEISVITRYVLKVADYFNRFCDEITVLELNDIELMTTRLLLVRATCQIIKNSLEIIGVEALNKV